MQALDFGPLDQPVTVFDEEAPLGAAPDWE